MKFNTSNIILYLYILFISYVIQDIPPLSAKTVLKPYKCAVCEDVVQTYHDKYNCRGHFTEKYPSLTNNVKSCTYPLTKTCSRFSGSLHIACNNLLNQLRTDSTMYSTLIDKLNYFGDPYKACEDLNKCTESADCKNSFKDSDGKQCYDNINCPSFTTSCTEECYLCVFIAKEFPLFRETCQIDVNGNSNSSAFIQISENLKIKNNLKLNIKNDPANSGSSNNIETENVEDDTLRTECFTQWDKFSSNSQALYYMSYKNYVNILNNQRDRINGNMWDANIVCKCLGMCPIQPLERLFLIEACYYDKEFSKIMFKDIIDVN